MTARIPLTMRSPLEKGLDDHTEAPGFFDVGIVARALEDDQPRVGNQPLHELAIGERCILVAVAPDQQRRTPGCAGDTRAGLR